MHAGIGPELLPSGDLLARAMRGITMKATKLLCVVAVVATVLLILYWAVMPASSPSWTGFGPYDEKVAGPRAKTLWEWMELLIVPIALAIGVWWLNKSEKDTERDIAKQRDATERELAAERQWQATLEAYFDRMANLLLNDGLRSSQSEEARIIARTRTLAVLRNLDRVRKGHVLRFLYESGLLKQGNSVVDLDDTDLVEAVLRDAKMPEVDLSNAHLDKSDLSRADLTRANLRGTHLVGASLKSANLTRAILTGADLSGADLREAQLDEADLGNANLNKADLEYASFSEANLLRADLEEANLTNANFHGARLLGARLRGAWVSGDRGVHLASANLMGAVLVDANLTRAYLREADLRGANLLGATLAGADLSEANLYDTSLDSSQLKEVESLHGATLPDGTKYDGRVALDRITSSHVLRAIEIINKKRECFRQIPEYVLVYKGEVYPLDRLVCLAYECQDGLPHDVFDTEEAKERLTALGFVVQKTIDRMPP